LGTRLALWVFYKGTIWALCRAYVLRTAVWHRLLRGWDRGSPPDPPPPDPLPPQGGLTWPRIGGGLLGQL
jgi:hypothetical protein